MKKITLIAFIFSILFFTRCNDDQLIPNCSPMDNIPCDRLAEFTLVPDTCFEINWSGGGFEIIQTGSDTFYSAPLYLEGTNEFIAYGRSITGLESKLWKYDLCKGEYSLLNDEFSFISSTIKSGFKDWISIGEIGGRIYISKLNGDSLMQLLPELECQFPVWIEMNEKIFCYCKLDPPIYFTNIILNSSGEILDTLDFVTANYGVYENKIAAIGTIENANFNHIGYVDIISKEFVDVIPRPDEEFGIPKDMGWLDSEHIVWIDKTGIHQVNINTAELTTLKEVCENVLYRRMSVVPEKKELLLSRTDRWHIGTDTLYSQTRLSVFNVETGVEEFIELE